MHDEEFMKIDFSKPFTGKESRLRKFPFSSTTLTQDQEYLMELGWQKFNSQFDNLLTMDQMNNEANVQKVDFTNTDLPKRMDYFLRKRTQELCRGIVSWFCNFLSDRELWA